MNLFFTLLTVLYKVTFYVFFNVCIRYMGIDLHMCHAIGAVGGSDAVCTRSTV